MIRRKQQVFFFVLGAVSVILAILFYRLGSWLWENAGMARVTKIGIAEYPSKIVYVIGKDTELDLTGGEIWMGTVEQSPSTYELSERNIGYQFEVFTDADFEKEGTYTVTIQRGASMQCSFPIQVISPDYVE